MPKSRKLYNPKRYVLLIEEDTFFTFQKLARTNKSSAPEILRMMVDMYIAPPERDEDISLLIRHIEHQTRYLVQDNQFEFTKINSWFVPEALKALNSSILAKPTRNKGKKIEINYREYLSVKINELGDRIITSSIHDIVITHNKDMTMVSLPDSYSASNNFFQMQFVIRNLIYTLDGLVRLNAKTEEK